MNEKIIDDYVNEVTKEMGAKQRDEVARELRTHILDGADALAAERGTIVDDAIVGEVIANMGPARKVAALYPTPATFLGMKELKGMWDAIKALGGIVLAFLLVAGVLWVVAPDVLNNEMIQVIKGIIGALALAIAVIAVIFAAMYFYESRLKVPYEARLQRLEKSLNDAGSPLKIGITVAGTIIWLALLNIFWAKVPFLASFGDDPQFVLLLSPDFGGFVPVINLIGVVTIAVQLLYLALRQKWIPSLLEAALAVVSALLFVWILAAFPFNPELSGGIQSGIKVVVAIVIVLNLFDAAKKLWQTGQLFLHQQFGPGSAA
ncbi:MAG: hypothetical protein A4E28_03215 [Methanocella sp. PtaU1.Bin125]|nr:MAG: hypothetical protein A4E28_03215 [Methanocella sp. PtaU1.Bin125]